MSGTSNRRLATVGVILALTSSVVLGLMTPAVAAPSGTQVGAAQPVTQVQVDVPVTVNLGVTHAQVTANQIHTVVRGDTLSGIAPRYNTTWPNLYNANTSVVSNPNLIYPGQKLTVPSGQVSKTAPAPAPVVASAPAPASSGWVNPVCASQIGDNIGAGRGHKGVDLAAPHGQPIRAAAAGTVTVGWQDGAGNYTIINHGDGVATAYLHQSSYAVRSGWVDAGQIIGYVGSTGQSSGPHLHFEVWTNGYWVGTFQDPISWMNNRGVRLGC